MSNPTTPPKRDLDMNDPEDFAIWEAILAEHIEWKRDYDERGRWFLYGLAVFFTLCFLDAW